MKTISRKATRKMSEIREKVTRVRMTLDGSRKDVGHDAPWDALKRFPAARLRDHEDGTYTVFVRIGHSYSLDTRPQGD